MQSRFFQMVAELVDLLISASLILTGESSLFSSFGHTFEDFHQNSAFFFYRRSNLLSGHMRIVKGNFQKVVNL